MLSHSRHLFKSNPELFCTIFPRCDANQNHQLNWWFVQALKRHFTATSQEVSNGPPIAYSFQAAAKAAFRLKAKVGQKPYFCLQSGRKGCPYDNSCIESFHSLLKKEEVYCRVYKNSEEAYASILEYIESWCNRRRTHSSLGYKTPEAVHAEGAV